MNRRGFLTGAVKMLGGALALSVLAPGKAQGTKAQENECRVYRPGYYPDGARYRTVVLRVDGDILLPGDVIYWEPRQYGKFYSDGERFQKESPYERP